MPDLDLNTAAVWSTVRAMLASTGGRHGAGCRDTRRDTGRGRRRRRQRGGSTPPSLALLGALALAACSGCVSHVVDLAEDHTIGLISRPITAPAELLWRVTTISSESSDRLHIKFLKLPRLDRQFVHALPASRQPMALEVMRQWLDREVGQGVSGEARLLMGGATFFPRLEEVLRSARRGIDVKTFIFDNDDVATAIADLLKEKSRRVPVRVVLDHMASRHAWSVTAPSAQGQPQPDTGNMARYLRRDSGVQVRSRYNVWFSSNHAKLVVVDGATAFLGGMNLGREYRYDWRDMMVEAHGPLVHELERQFGRAWTRTRFLSDFFLLAEDSAEPGTNCTPDQPRFHILETTPFRHEIYKAQLFAARNAGHHIYVENPYMWNTKFIYSLCEARHRGVDVRVTASMSVDFETVSGATRVALNTLIRHGVRVFLYPGMTHVKAAVYDGWACFGSANFDDLSLHKNIELNLCTDDPGFVRQIETQLLLDGQDQSKEIKEPLPTSFWDELSRRVADFL